MSHGILLSLHHPHQIVPFNLWQWCTMMCAYLYILTIKHINIMQSDYINQGQLNLQSTERQNAHIGLSKQIYKLPNIKEKKKKKKKMKNTNQGLIYIWSNTTNISTCFGVFSWYRLWETPCASNSFTLPLEYSSKRHPWASVINPTRNAHRPSYAIALLKSIYVDMSICWMLSCKRLISSKSREVENSSKIAWW